MNAFSDRIAELIGGDRRLSAFARECDLPTSTVRQYLDGSVPGLDKVIQIARAKKVRLEWLATGEGPRGLQSEAPLASRGTEQERGGRMLVEGMELAPIHHDMVSLPRLSISASAGNGLIPLEEEVEGFLAIKRDYLTYIDVSPAHAHIAQLSGDSMKPTLLDRDLIIVDTSKTKVLNERIYAVVYGEAVLAKRLQLLWDGSVRIMSDNKADGYADEIVPVSERHNLRIVGQIKGYLRHF